MVVVAVAMSMTMAMAVVMTMSMTMTMTVTMIVSVAVVVTVALPWTMLVLHFRLASPSALRTSALPSLSGASWGSTFARSPTATTTSLAGSR